MASFWFSGFLRRGGGRRGFFSEMCEKQGSCLLMIIKDLQVCFFFFARGNEGVVFKL